MQVPRYNWSQKDLIMYTDIQFTVVDSSPRRKRSRGYGKRRGSTHGPSTGPGSRKNFTLSTHFIPRPGLPDFPV